MAGSSLFRAILFACALFWAPVALAQLLPQGGSDSAGESASAPSAAWFRAERLNAGLPPPPAELDRATPMGTVESLLELVRTRRYEAAAHLLDLSRVPEAEQAERGPDLARKLGFLIDTVVWLDWSDLPDRPDAVVETSAGSMPRAGEMRRSLVVGDLELGSRPVPLRLRRVKPGDGDPVWLFAPQTVAEIDALYLEHGPGWVRDRVSHEWKAESWLSLQRWEVVGLPLVLVAAVGVFLGLRTVFGWLAAAVPWSAGSTALKGARTPLALLAATVPLYWATLHFITFSAPITAVLSPLLIGAMVLAVAMAALRALDRLIEHFARRLVGDPDTEYDERQRRRYTTIYAIRRIGLLVAVVVGLGVVLSRLEIFSAVGVSLLASAGVLTVILGIAAQPILGNILSSLQIALAKPIRIGDAVSYEGRWAYVEGIFYTFVRLRTWDDRRLVVPVQYFTSHPFENYSMVERKMTRVFLITLDPRADVDELRHAYLDMARADEDVMQDEMLKVLVVEHDHNGMVVRFYCTAKDASVAWNMHCRLREKTLAWIRDNHPDWWPRVREIQFNADAAPATTYGEAAE